MKKKMLLSLVALMLVTSLVMAGCAGEAEAPAPGPAPTPAPAPAPAPEPEQIVLKAAGYTTLTRLYDMGLNYFMDRIYARSDGRIIVDYRGGPESIPEEEQGIALQKGIIDLNWFHIGTWGHVPEHSILEYALHNPDGTFPQEVHDFMNKRFNQDNAMWLISTRHFMPWYIASNKKVATIADFSGMSISCFASERYYTFIRDSLGAEPTSVGEGEEFVALQRGLVDAMFVTADDWKLGLHEVAKYIISPSWRWRSTNSLYMNLETFNKLSPELQDIVTEVAASVTKDILIRDVGNAQSNLRVWLEACEEIRLTGADAEILATGFADVTWGDVKGKVSPETYNEMRALAVVGEGTLSLPE